MGLLTLAILTMALLTMALLTMGLLTMGLLTMGLLTMGLLTMAPAASDGAQEALHNLARGRSCWAVAPWRGKDRTSWRHRGVPRVGRYRGAG